MEGDPQTRRENLYLRTIYQSSIATMTITFGTDAELPITGEPPMVVDICMEPRLATLLPAGWRFTFSKAGDGEVFAEEGRKQRVSILKLSKDSPFPPTLIGPMLRDFLNNFVAKSNPSPSDYAHSSYITDTENN